MTKKEKYLFFDTELSGCDQLVSIGYVVTDSSGEEVANDYYLIKPRKAIRKNTIAIHGITTEQAQREGISLKKGVSRLCNVIKDSMVIVGFAPQNDILALAIGCRQIGRDVPLSRGECIIVDVARLGVQYMISRGKIQPGQTPNLSSLYSELFDGEKYDEHNALSDAVATARCFWRLMSTGWFTYSAIIPHSKTRGLCECKKPQRQRQKKYKSRRRRAEATATDGTNTELPSPTQAEAV